jgi:NDP-sugar pyrophosphorylase family protein
MLVLITTSGTGSRLGKLTQFTNKSLVPVGDSFAISRIIEAYPPETEFVITVGYLRDLVKEFCSLAYPTRKIQFVEVDVYEGPGSSLLYSMLQAKNFLQSPFYFHCCDTIVTKPIVCSEENTLYVTKHDDFQNYASITGSNGVVKALHKKGYGENNFIYIGIAYYKDYKTFWKEAERIYSSNKSDTTLSDIHCIMAMLQYSTFHYSVETNVYDTGNQERYLECLQHFKTSQTILAKPNESLHFQDDFVIKFISDSSFNKKRVVRGKMLSPHAPKILGFTEHFLKMEFVKGTLLAESCNYTEVGRLLDWAKTNLWKNQVSNPMYRKTCELFYFTKTKERLAAINLQHEKMCINGLYTDSITSLLSKIPVELLLSDTLSDYHGDFILDNIIKKEDGSYCLLDWRHEFGNQVEKGDMYYDLAKLKHNIIFNHKNILDNLFSVNEKDSNITIELKCNYTLICQLESFYTFLNENTFSRKKVDILTALVWLNMAPLYEDPLRKFLFYFGKLHLYLAVSTLRPYESSNRTTSHNSFVDVSEYRQSSAASIL